jgi:hypothetical protein
VRATKTWGERNNSYHQPLEMRGRSWIVPL